VIRPKTAGESCPGIAQVNILAQQALDLIVNRELEEEQVELPGPYGGLETASTTYGVEGKLVRIGTLQDWEGDDPNPDFHIVITDEVKESEKDVIVKETTYDFYFKSSWRGRGSYQIPDVRDEIVVYPLGKEERQRIVPTAGRGVLKLLRGTKMPRRERKVLESLAAGKFTNERYLALTGLIEACGEHNRIDMEPESEE
jgi:hypothetical protein